MKKIYLLGTLTAILAVSCTPDTKELDTLKKPEISTPQVNNPPVDLSKTVVVFTPNETVEKIFRDPTTKTSSATTFSFAPKYAKRALETGEVVNLKIEHEKVAYERTLPEGSFSIDVATLNSATASATFKVSLKADAFKTLDITQEYVLRFRVKVVSTTPADVPVITSNDDSVYRIKISFVESLYPQDDNIEVVDRVDDDLLEGLDYTLESNYAQNHLNKLKDGNEWTNWYIDTTNEDIYLSVKFREETTLNGIIITQNQTGPRRESKTIGKMDIYASPDNVKTYLQGTYERDKYRGKIYIRFKKPIDVKTLTLKNFKKYNNKYIDTYEIEFF